MVTFRDPHDRRLVEIDDTDPAQKHRVKILRDAGWEEVETPSSQPQTPTVIEAAGEPEAAVAQDETPDETAEQEPEETPDEVPDEKPVRPKKG